MPEVSLFRLYLLRAMYALIAFGLAATFWPSLLNPHHPWELMEGIVNCMLAAFSLLCLLGIRYPLEMLPVLLWETLWKTMWLVLVAFPQWRAGRIDPAIVPNIFATGMVLLVYLAVPWPYVFNRYLRQPASRWQ